MTRQVNLYEAKTNLSQLVEDAARGEEIIIAKNGKPMVKLVVVGPAEAPKKRQLGQFAHLFDPKDKRTRAEWLRDWRKLDEEILKDFECLQEEPGEFDSKWPDTSSTPTPSSGPKRSRSGSGARRSKK
jgi:prevent-host-death family protein